MTLIETKPYVLAIEGPAKPFTPDLPPRLAQMDVAYDMPSRVQCNAAEKEIEKICNELGGDFHFKEVAGREPQG